MLNDYKISETPHIKLIKSFQDGGVGYGGSRTQDFLSFYYIILYFFWKTTLFSENEARRLIIIIIQYVFLQCTVVSLSSYRYQYPYRITRNKTYVAGPHASHKCLNTLAPWRSRLDRGRRCKEAFDHTSRRPFCVPTPVRFSSGFRWDGYPIYRGGGLRRVARTKVWRRGQVVCMRRPFG